MTQGNFNKDMVQTTSLGMVIRDRVTQVETCVKPSPSPRNGGGGGGGSSGGGAAGPCRGRFTDVYHEFACKTGLTGSDPCFLLVPHCPGSVAEAPTIHGTNDSCADENEPFRPIVGLLCKLVTLPVLSAKPERW